MVGAGIIGTGQVTEIMVGAGTIGTGQTWGLVGVGIIGMALILDGDGITGGDLIMAIMVGVDTIIIIHIIILTAMVFVEVVQVVVFQEDMILVDLELLALETILL